MLNIVIVYVFFCLIIGKIVLQHMSDCYHPDHPFFLCGFFVPLSELKSPKMIVQFLLLYLVHVSQADAEAIIGKTKFPDVAQDGGFACFKLPVNEQYRIALKDEVVTSQQGNETAKEGDYIIHSTKNESGTIVSFESPLSPSSFDETYDIIKAWNKTNPTVYGICRKKRIKIYCKQITNGSFEFVKKGHSDILTGENGSFLIQNSAPKQLSNGTWIGDYNGVDKQVFVATYGLWSSKVDDIIEQHGQEIVIFVAVGGVVLLIIGAIGYRHYRKVKRMQQMEEYQKMQMEDHLNDDGL